MKTVLLLPAVLLSCAFSRAGVFGTAFNVPADCLFFAVVNSHGCFLF